MRVFHKHFLFVSVHSYCFSLLPLGFSAKSLAEAPMKSRECSPCCRTIPIAPCRIITLLDGWACVIPSRFEVEPSNREHEQRLSCDTWNVHLSLQEHFAHKIARMDINKSSFDTLLKYCPPAINTPLQCNVPSRTLSPGLLSLLFFCYTLH